MRLSNLKINMGVATDRKIRGCNSYYSHPYGYMTHDKDCGVDISDEYWDYNTIASIPAFTPNQLSYDWTLQDFKIKFTTNSIIPASAWINFKAKDPKTLLFNHNVQPVLTSSDDPSVSNALACTLKTSYHKYYQCQNTGGPLIEGSYTVWFKSMHVTDQTSLSREEA